jgi:hypothetical protein
MGQLIKLQDYISRYEQDIYRYPIQFVRLKQQQWEKVKAAYLAGELEKHYGGTGYSDEDDELYLSEKSGILSKMKNMFARNDRKDEQVVEQARTAPENVNVFSLHLPARPESLDELKQAFLNQLLRFQMKWGSSTLYEKSFIDQGFILDEKLRFFLQRFPDTCLVLYKPIFLLKNAPVEAECILITPTEVWCLSFLEGEEDAAFEGSNERFWMKRHHIHPDKKVLNPMLSLKRMEQIVSGILSLYEVTLPVKKAILSRNGYIDYPLSPFDVQLLDKRHFPDWFKRMRSSQTPLKHQQLKAAQALLEYCQTTSSRRQEWNQEPQETGHDESTS